MITIIHPGDVTHPRRESPPLFVAHICNDWGVWGAGVSGPIGEMWPSAKNEYLTRRVRILGTVQFVPQDSQLTVVNMISQKGVRRWGQVRPPIRYDALESCLDKLRTEVLLSHGSVHMPKIGSGLAGGRWDVIEEIVNRVLHDVPVFVYIP